MDRKMGPFAYLRKEAIPVTIIGGPFRGARMMLKLACSKRKILGVYEHMLNPWLRRVLPSVQVVWDIGANDGYFTYGCAHMSCKDTRENPMWLRLNQPPPYAMFSPFRRTGRSTQERVLNLVPCLSVRHQTTRQ